MIFEITSTIYRLFFFLSRRIRLFFFSLIPPLRPPLRPVYLVLRSCFVVFLFLRPCFCSLFVLLLNMSFILLSTVDMTIQRKACFVNDTDLNTTINDTMRVCL